MIIIIMLIIIKMTTLSTYYQWNRIQISNKKKLEAMSSQVKWKASAAVEQRTEWSSGSGSRQGKNRDSAEIQGCAAKNMEVCPLSPPLGCHWEPLLWGLPSLFQAKGSHWPLHHLWLWSREVCPGSPLGRNSERSRELGAIQSLP